MKTNETHRSGIRFLLLRWTALLLALCFLPVFASAEESAKDDDWVTFLLICNEGMNNDKGNAGNTLMVTAMNPVAGKIRLMMFTWDTFIDYPGYDVPQKLDMPYRNNGPEEAIRVLNDNFGLNITHFLSLNYLNLASLIDEYGGITVDVSRAERNALNGMVASKKVRLQEEVASGLLSQTVIDLLAKDYYLNDFGPDTRLNGLQAVGYGWLQYDSVYNCCERDAEVVSSLFHSASIYMSKHVVFYRNETGFPGNADGRRAINLDEMTEEDYEFVRQLIDPIFRMSSNDMSEEEIHSIAISLAHISYQANREGVDILDYLRTTVLPLEATQPYDLVAGAQGHLVDKEANRAAVQEFLYGEN